MKLYDTLSGEKREFRPLDGRTVKMYVCGVTPYDTTHLGHAFTYVVFDVLIRYLESAGRSVRYVQNVTDIDDDILRKAGEEGIDWRDLGERETTRFLKDLAALNVRPPDVYPRATQEIEKILEIAEELVRKGFAYERNGSVYFRVHSDPGFGKLSRYDYATMLATAKFDVYRTLLRKSLMVISKSDTLEHWMAECERIMSDRDAEPVDKLEANAMLVGVLGVMIEEINDA